MKQHYMTRHLYVSRITTLITSPITLSVATIGVVGTEICYESFRLARLAKRGCSKLLEKIKE